MPHSQRLLKRLDEIGQSLAQSGQALALLGLGSVGVETARLDQYSDLDFFAIVQPGRKTHFLQDLSWLTNIAPAAYYFQNTADGYKFLYTDGIFCEFAVFEPQELSQIPFAEGRIVWKTPEVADEIRQPTRPSPTHTRPSVEWSLGEALTCLYVGLGRYQRGEKLSAQRFVQHFTVDRVIELAAGLEAAPAGVFVDPFAPERRVEKRLPHLAQWLPQFVPGYDHTPQAAAAILTFLEQHFDVNPTLAQLIRANSEVKI